MIQPNSPQPDGPFQPGSALAPIQGTGQSSAEYYLKLGKQFYHSYLARSRQQDLDKAVLHFQKAVEIEPNLPEAYVQLASALWDQGTINLELAQFYCETALKLDPKQAEANLFLGYFLQRAGFWTEAVTQFSTAIKKRPIFSARPRIALGNLLLKQALKADKKTTQVSLSIQGLTQFMTGCLLLPVDRQTCSILSEALLTDGQVYTIQTLAQGFKMMKMPQFADSVYKLGARMLPKEPVFYHLLGDMYLFDQRQPTKAIEWYRQAQTLDPDNLALTKKLGKAYSETKDTAKAVDAFNAVVEQQISDYDALYQLAQLHTEEKAYFKALYYFKECEKQRPHDPYVHSNMAYVLYKMEDIEGALEEYKIAFEYGTEPQWLSTVAQTIATIAYQVLENTDQALEYIQLSLQYHPDNLDALALLADLYFETSQLELAISTYRAILEQDPNNADCYSNIGYILWQMDQNQAAIDAYMAALYYDKHNPVVYNNLGVIYLDDMAEPEKALPLFQSALDLKPNYTMACFNKARTLEALGKSLEAAELYSKCLEMNQVNPELEESEITSRLNHLFDS